MEKFAIQYTPTGDLLDAEGFLSSPDWSEKDVMLFESRNEAETYLLEHLTGIDGFGWDHTVMEYRD